MIPRLLLFEPDASRSEDFRKQLEDLHLWIAAVENPESGFELLKKQFFHLCVWSCDNDQDLAALSRIRQLRPETAIIAVSEKADSDHVVDCIRHGASNFWGREPSVQGLVEAVRKTMERTVADAPADADEFEYPELAGRHPSIKKIFKVIHQIKDSDSTILITGESGTGKELVARAVHSLSHRTRQPFVAVNCSAIPANLLESELFGHVKGAFTGATQNRAGRFSVAGNGTLFLDEIGELPIDLQAKILRALQHKVFEPVGSAQSLTLNARIIAATNQNLDNAVAEKRFREDLFYRLNVIPVFMPPLRSRKSDVPLLVGRFLERFNKLNRKHFSGISEEAMHCLMQYHWPGNIRELENLIERVVVLKEGAGLIELKDFPVGYFRNVRLERFVANVAFPEEGLNFNDAVNEFENELILQALRSTQGNKNKAASLLKLNRTTLVEKLKRKGLRIVS
ncbi:MAG: sigma-54-dependent Fis family transcriptional regulator [Bdellovibrionaceae bacterium]|nr:sigma-54-dependent Fis family transcriptional regulator [Bdellovibrionales bacterium]MCB9254366.1 sigma-54-dependent Fis family transcriptional regulator [Pseudobdellovibrionaceae bacterium]